MSKINLIKQYTKNKKLFDNVKSSVEHCQYYLKEEEKAKEADALRLATKSHQNRKIRLLDEMIHDVDIALLQAKAEGNTHDADILLRRVKKLNTDRSNYLQELEAKKDVEDPEEPEDPKKKKKKEEEEESSEEEKEMPEKEDGTSKKKKDAYMPEGSEIGGPSGSADPSEERKQEEEREKKKKKKKEESEE